MAIRYDPKTDIVFRKLFGSEANLRILIALINSIVGPAIHVVDVAIKNPYNLAAYIGSKSTIRDIKAVDQNGIWYDIEMPVTDGAPTRKGRRATSYPSSLGLI